MHIDPITTLEGRNLVLAYAAVILIQGGYFLRVLYAWRKVAEEEKSKEASSPASLSEEYRR